MRSLTGMLRLRLWHGGGTGYTAAGIIGAPRTRPRLTRGCRSIVLIMPAFLTIQVGFTVTVVHCTLYHSTNYRTTGYHLELRLGSQSSNST